ncbi:MAG: glycosyltransferase family 2 protein [Bacteroidales bacterium]|nr:glycosyltransferase family 2 protein [Bacteroidales bacterium]
MEIAVAILNWNGKSWLEKFLSNVVENSPMATVYVIDNASTDESISFLKQEFPQVPIIQLDKNYGFAEGYNQGLAQIQADYFVLLNSDVQVTPHWITPIIEKMESNPNLAVCMPKLKSFHNPEYFEYAGAAGGFIDTFGYPFCHGRLFNSIEKDEKQYEEDCEIFWASGAALFVKANIYKELGGLDKDFFAHMEEIDFCWRVKNAGYSLQYIHNAEVFHVGGGSLPKENPFKTFLNFRNNLFMLHKNLPDDCYKRIIFKRRLLDAVSWLNFVAHFDFKNAKEILHAHKEYRKAIPDLEQKRTAIPNKTFHAEIYPKSIVWAYFVKHAQRIDF